ncbi:Copper-binding lipoprotein NosL [Sinobacterium norvegicum]|uniref:Copper-binding lipoprotein NosL n=1 Tax=Sinobacterium norvegicum TaxID=1641715 RepID=A0ABM9AE90_9GAMM|nr:nitrous oxide reductase accessory protein NosL [Sinobacterium norvegicum]CAH0991529.1 Copper-binding lipoprotein NosL [Sinobacterium norvegicum]
MKNIAGFLPNIAIILFVLLSGCEEKKEQPLASPKPVIIQDHDECDLCGMYINAFPGPKGQIFERGLNHPKRFCSTRDMFAYALQPEHRHRIEHIFVHDVSSAPWDHQESAQYIDASSAFFVSGHKLNGAMGPALASFSTRADATNFVREQGGSLFTFKQIDIEVLNKMSHQPMNPD